MEVNLGWFSDMYICCSYVILWLYMLAHTVVQGFPHFSWKLKQCVPSIFCQVYVFAKADDFKTLLEPLQDVARKFKTKVNIELDYLTV